MKCLGQEHNNVLGQSSHPNHLRVECTIYKATTPPERGIDTCVMQEGMRGLKEGREIKNKSCRREKTKGGVVR